MIRVVAMGMYLAGVSIIPNIDAGTLVVICGAVIFAVATWRRDSRDVLRRQNTDLSDRNKTLEDDRGRLQSENHKLAALPNLEKVYELVGRHDREARDRDERVITVLSDVSRELGAIGALLHAIAATRPLSDIDGGNPT